MSSIGEVIGWKFKNQEGMATVDGELTELPGGLPTEAEVAAWRSEYEARRIEATARVAADQAATQVAKATPVIKYLATHTPAECEAYVAANVTDLPSAKSLLGKFAIALCVLSRREFRQDEQ